MTDLQRQLAGSAHRIYMDATYKNAPTGFKQLFTINSFIANSSGDMIQVPLCFVFMTRRRKVDYVEVLTAFRKLLLGVAVQSVLTDFEIALWSAVREVFPEATHFGCLFHWTQAIMNKVKDLGLANAYRNHSNTRQAIQQLLCLPYLPHSKIPGVFYYLMENAPKETHPLFAYVKSTWIENKRTPWGPETWSVFNKPVRTNNDCEGLHNRWNLRTKNRKAYYWILSCLLKEATRIEVTSTLLTCGLLKRHQKKNDKLKQKTYFDLWDNYVKSESKTSSLKLLNDFVEATRISLPSLDSITDASHSLEV